jgi:uncharacterized protein
MRRIAIPVVITGVVTSLIVLGLTVDFLVDWAWFSAVGYLPVYWTMVSSQALVLFVTFVGSAALLLVNGSLAYQFAQSGRGNAWVDTAGAYRHVETLPEGWEITRRRLPWGLLIGGTAGLLGLLIAAWEMSHWEVFLRFIYQVPYGQSDPLYGKDLSFYLFSLPAYLALKNWLWLTLFFSAVMAGIVYWVNGGIRFGEQRWSMSPAAVAHGSVLLGLFFAMKVWSYVLDRFLLLYGDNGVVVGASYTDVHVELPILWLLAGLAGVASLASLANVWVRTARLPAASAVLVFGGSLVLSQVFPALFQRIFVKPNELQLEKPYLQHNIALTQQAYNLQQIRVTPFPAEQNLTWQMLQANNATVDNIRLWDWQPLMDTYG